MVQSCVSQILTFLFFILQGSSPTQSWHKAEQINDKDEQKQKGRGLKMTGTTLLRMSVSDSRWKPFKSISLEGDKIIQPPTFVYIMLE